MDPSGQAMFMPVPVFSASRRRRTGRSCAFRRSPRTTRPGRSMRNWDGTRLPGSAARHCTPSASHWRSWSKSAQHQQMPPPQGGRMVKAAWFRSYAPNERPDKFDRIVQSWDTANKPSELSPHPSLPRIGGGKGGGAPVGGSRTRTSTCYMCCASAWNILS